MKHLQQQWVELQTQQHQQQEVLHHLLSRQQERITQTHRDIQGAMTQEHKEEEANIDREISGEICRWIFRVGTCPILFVTIMADDLSLYNLQKLLISGSEAQIHCPVFDLSDSICILQITEIQ